MTKLAFPFIVHVASSVGCRPSAMELCHLIVDDIFVGISMVAFLCLLCGIERIARMRRQTSLLPPIMTVSVRPRTSYEGTV